MSEAHWSLGALRDGRLRVVAPIAVQVRVDQAQIILEATELDEYGFGETCAEARVDLQRAIAELFWTLDAEQHRLGPDLARVWSSLQQKIRRRPSGVR